MYQEDSSSSFYACIDALFSQAGGQPPHQSLQLSVNPSSSTSVLGSSSDSPAQVRTDKHAADKQAGSGEMMAIHAHHPNQGVEGHHINDHIRRQSTTATSAAAATTAADAAASVSPPSPSPVPPLPPKSPTMCLADTTPLETSAVAGRVNPAFVRDQADSAESNNNKKNDLIEDLESIQIADQSASKSKSDQPPVAVLLCSLPAEAKESNFADATLSFACLLCMQLLKRSPSTRQ